MDELVVRGHAKINLGLDVLRKREDGYHEVRMVMQTIGVYDTLTLKKNDGGIRLTVDRADLEADERNLAYRAAKLLFEDCAARGAAVSGGVDIMLNKRIPMAAGLAGGSTDCAAVLRGINELFDMKYTQEDLKRLGVRLGADVPYCVMEGTALAEGIGEVLTALSPCPPCLCLIAKPPIDVSTKFVYGNLHADRLQEHPDIDGLVRAVQEKNLSAVAAKMGNVLETVTVPAYPVIGQLKQIMKDSGALNAMMSGSGPTVFGLFDSVQKAEAARRSVEESGLSGQTELAELYPAGTDMRKRY